MCLVKRKFFFLSYQRLIIPKCTTVTRSPSPGASISHTNPKRQPLRVSFYFRNYGAFRFARTLCHTEQYNTIQHSTTQLNTTQHNTIQCTIQLLVFSVTPFKLDQNKKSKPFNRLSLESGNRKKVDMQRLSPRLRLQHFFLWEIRGETFSPNL